MSYFTNNRICYGDSENVGKNGDSENVGKKDLNLTPSDVEL